MDFWKRLTNNILLTKKVGDTVAFDATQIKEGIYEGCPICYDEKMAEEGWEPEIGVLTTFKNEDLCEEHKKELGV